MLYAIVLDWPKEGKVNITSLASNSEFTDGLNIKNVQLLGNSEKIEWIQTDQGLLVNMPKERPCDFAYVIALTL